MKTSRFKRGCLRGEFALSPVGSKIERIKKERR